MRALPRAQRARCWRVLRVRACMCCTAWRCARCASPRSTPRGRHAAHPAGGRRELLRALGVRLQVERRAARPAPTLLRGQPCLVARHRRAARGGAAGALRLQGRRAAWPLLGWLIKGAGTLFIERERKRDALRVVHQMAEALQAGDTVAVFPEGTTGDGRALLPFHANLLQAAIATGTPVQPVALRYTEPGHRFSPAVAVRSATTTLLHSVWRMACARGLGVHVELLPAAGSAHADRRALAESPARADRSRAAAASQSPRARREVLDDRTVAGLRRRAPPGRAAGRGAGRAACTASSATAFPTARPSCACRPRCRRAWRCCAACTSRTRSWPS